MTEQPVNLSTVIYLGVFSRAEQRVLQVIFKEIAEGDGRRGIGASICADFVNPWSNTKSSASADYHRTT
jgi:hypothetical protein